MNTKKDFIRAANIISQSEKSKKKILLQAFIEFFKNDNPKFDQDKFVEFCQK